MFDAMLSRRKWMKGAGVLAATTGITYREVAGEKYGRVVGWTLGTAKGH